MLSVTACGGAVIEPPRASPSTARSSVAPATTNASRGFGTLIRLPGEFDSGWNAPLTGKLSSTSTGCWAVIINDAEYLMALPAGFTTTDVPGQAMIVGADGVTIAAGSDFDGFGSIAYPPEFPGGDTGRWAEYVASCEPPSQELVVFDRIEPAFDPETLSEAELAALVQSADLVDDWPCGIGFARSTTDQRVGILISATGPVDGATAELPAPGWQAAVMVGRQLFANNCDDIVEPWEPTRVVAASWPLHGTLRIIDPVPVAEGCGPVRARLEGGTIVTDSGTVSLGDLELFNDEFGCFAG